jgi:hypothetical protein
VSDADAFSCGRIYLKAGATDLRRSIDGLAGLVREEWDSRRFRAICFVPEPSEIG